MQNPNAAEIPRRAWWSYLGYGTCLPPIPFMDKPHNVVTSYVYLTLKDRLKLMFTGKLMFSTLTHFETEVKALNPSMSAMSILPASAEFRQMRK